MMFQVRSPQMNWQEFVSKPEKCTVEDTLNLVSSGENNIIRQFATK